MKYILKACTKLSKTEARTPPEYDGEPIITLKGINGFTYELSYSHTIGPVPDVVGEEYEDFSDYAYYIRVLWNGIEINQFYYYEEKASELNQYIVDARYYEYSQLKDLTGVVTHLDEVNSSRGKKTHCAIETTHYGYIYADVIDADNVEEGDVVNVTIHPIKDKDQSLTVSLYKAD